MSDIGTIAFGNVASAVAIGHPVVPVYTLTATGNVTITLKIASVISTGYRFLVMVTQDGTGGRTVAWAGDTVLWDGGSAPTASDDANDRTVYELVRLSPTLLAGRKLAADADT